MHFFDSSLAAVPLFTPRHQAGAVFPSSRGRRTHVLAPRCAGGRCDCHGRSSSADSGDDDTSSIIYSPCRKNKINARARRRSTTRSTPSTDQTDRRKKKSSALAFSSLPLPVFSRTSPSVVERTLELPVASPSQSQRHNGVLATWSRSSLLRRRSSQPPLRLLRVAALAPVYQLRHIP